MGRTVAVSGKAAEEATKGFAALLPGKYIAKIMDVKDGKFGDKSENKGREKIAVRFKIIEGPEGVGRQFTDFNIPLFPEWASGKTAASFFKFFKAVGVEFPDKDSDADIDLPDNEDLLGEEIGITLKTEQKYGQTDPDVTESKVDSFGYFPASDGLPDVAIGEDEFTL